MTVNSERRVLLSRVAAFLAVGTLALGAGWLGVGTAGAAVPGITISYTTPTTIQVTLTGGTAITSGSVIPAGSYGITVNDDPNTGDLNPDLTVTGPDVSLSQNLNSTGMGIDATSYFGPYTFAADSSYRIEDTNIGASTLVTFTTSSASNTAAAAATTTTTTAAATTTTTTTASKGSTTKTSTVSASATGAKGGQMVGTLEGSISASGKATLTFDGKRVTKIKAGRYTVKVADHSKSVKLLLGEVSKQPMKLGGGGASVSSRTVSLGVGRWFFAPSGKGSKTSFTVVA
jgi:hypothetical protein